MNSKVNSKTQSQVERLESVIASLKPGVVSAVEVQTDVNRRSIYIDGSFAFGVSVFVLEKQPVRIGETITVEHQEGLVRADFAARARGIAVNYPLLQTTNEERTGKAVTEICRRFPHCYFIATGV